MEGVDPGVFSRERRRLTLGILFAVATFAADGMGVVPALPTAVRALDGLPLFGWAFSMFMIAWLVGTTAAGQLADVRGPGPPMALGLGAFGAGLLLSAAAGGMAQFLAGRALQGLGGGAIVAAAYVAIARGYPDALRARMMALTASVWILPAVVGPALSGALAERGSWRLVFAGIVPLLVLTAALVLPPLRGLAVDGAERMPERSGAGVSRVPAALWLALGVTFVLAAPSLRAWGAWAMLASAVAGSVLLFPALRALLPPGTLLGRPGLPRGLLARGLLAFGFFGAEAYVPLGAGLLRGASPTRGGLALSAAAVGWIGASWAQDRREARAGAGGRTARVAAGLLLVAFGIVVVAATLVTELPFLLVPLGWAVAGVGIGFAYSAGSLLCLDAAPRGQEGEVSGQMQLVEALGTAAGTGAGGALLDLLGRLDRPPREAHALVFALMLGAALFGAGLSSSWRTPCWRTRTATGRRRTATDRDPVRQAPPPVR